jgi:hypothetical protein
MARERTFTRETRLWNSKSGEWDVFPAGEQDPGPAWSEIEGGTPDGGVKTASAALAELAAVTKRAEDAEQRIGRLQHDCAQRNQEATVALAEVARLTEAMILLQRERDEAEANKLRMAEERDRAIQNESDVRQQLAVEKAKIAAFDGDNDGAPGGSKPKAAAKAPKAAA